MPREEFLELYARLEFVTIPLRPREKRPLRREWQKPDPRAWDGAPSDANVGILTGAASGGLLVVDLDYEEGPFDVFGLRPRELATHTMVVRTGRGWHVYTRASDLRTRSPRPGVDLRGNGAMVVAPPSVHPSGRPYIFEGSTRVIARLEVLLPSGFDDEPRPLSHEEPPVEIPWEELESWIALQAPKLQEAWGLLREPTRPFDRSRADFAVARCLWESGRPEEDVVRVLLALPGSKAKERGEAYAVRTAQRAAGATGRRKSGGSG